MLWPFWLSTILLVPRDDTLFRDVTTPNIGNKGCVCDNTVNNLSVEPISKCKNKVFSINPVWNEHNEGPIMPWVEAGNVKHELLRGLRNEQVHDLNMILTQMK